MTAICPIGQETWDSTANLLWPMFFVAFLVLLWNPRRPVPIAVGAATAVLATLTSPFGLLLAPVAVARIIALGRTRGSVIAVATLAGALVQTAVMVTAGGRQSYTTVLPGTLADDYAFNVAERGFFGLRYLRFGLGHTSDYRMLGAAVAAAAAVAVLAAGAAGKGRHSAIDALALAYSAGYYVVVLVVSGTFIGKAGGTRYYVGPLMLLAYAVAVVFDAAVTGPWRGGAAPWAARLRPAGLRLGGYVPRLAALILCAALTACLAFSVVTDWNMPDKNRQHPTWPQSLAAARAWCAREPGDATVHIRIDASFPAVPWYVRLSCSRVR